MNFYFWGVNVMCVLVSIKTQGKSQLALTITGKSVGFKNYDPNLSDQQLEIFEKTISRNNLKLCTSSSPLNSSEVRLCVSKTPINAQFEQISLNNFTKFTIRGNNVLAVGDFNVNTDMYDAVVLEESKAMLNKMFFVVKPINKDLAMKPFKSSHSNKE